ncbi:hypothetical protein CR513_55199, partial [Mucuna pruriens]
MVAQISSISLLKDFYKRKIFSLSVDLNGHGGSEIRQFIGAHGGFDFEKLNDEGYSILNTCFKKQRERLITYKSISSKSQIDFFLLLIKKFVRIARRFQKRILLRNKGGINRKWNESVHDKVRNKKNDLKSCMGAIMLKIGQSIKNVRNETRKAMSETQSKKPSRVFQRSKDREGRM